MGESDMKDSSGRPIATLNVPIIRKKKTKDTYALSVNFEATVNLKDFLTFQDDNEMYRYLSAYLFEHINRFYWGERK